MEEQSHPHGGIGESAECQLCPVCVLLQAVTTSRPEVTRHLLAAGQELTLAVKAALDHHVEGYGDDGGRLRRIKID